MISDATMMINLNGLAIHVDMMRIWKAVDKWNKRNSIH